MRLGKAFHPSLPVSASTLPLPAGSVRDAEPRGEAAAVVMSLSEPRGTVARETVALETLARELSCPVCLQLFSDPVTLPCGHNYCRACVEGTARGDPPHRCPECRAEYGGAGALRSNFKLRGIIESYKATAETAETAGAEETTATVSGAVRCEHCLDDGKPAVKTCLRCDVSLCAQHLQRHLLRDAAKRHSLVEPRRGAGPASACPLHREEPEYFCGGDGAFLCAACLAQGGHRDHDVKTLEAAEAEFRRALEGQEKEARTRLQMAELLAQRGSGDEAVFRVAGDKLGSKALALLGGMADLVDGYRARLVKLLDEDRRRLEEGWRESLRQFGEQQRLLREAQRDAAAVLRESDRHRFVRLFLEAEPSIRAATASGGPAPAPAAMPAPLDVKKLSAGARTDHFRAEVARLLQALVVLLCPLELTFDPNTAHPSLLLSNDLRTAKYSAAKLPQLDHPDRFQSAPQVLCAQGFSGGEHVWVVEMGPCMWSVGLSYKSVPRRGDHSRLGHNPVSWRVQWKNRKLTACHASCNVALAEAVPPSRVEVALDYEGGTLSFHSVAGGRQHLHTFRATFRETVYPAFSIHSTTPQSWITLQS
ncbi:E3 ubiquitin/ISG15 ligase TRIM25-like [Anguilla rostrata]|uniref:E3 ubiquitin/ISG15 ligase TRIM25-like n=1 Tax=Anguilla rostrata TaxID=7938 RepID=UPI0030CB602D